jgi:N-acetylmuramoyl-L-alanine amidase
MWSEQLPRMLVNSYNCSEHPTKKANRISVWSVSFFALIISLITVNTLQAAESVKSVRFWQAPDSTRIVFDLSGPVSHQAFLLVNPTRLVVDISNSNIGINLDKVDANSSLIKKVRSSKPPKSGVSRVVFELNQSVSVNSFVLKPYQQYGDRLVVDLTNKNSQSQKVESYSINKKLSTNRNVIIAVDAGHGGEDPGALGPKGTLEKHVTLAIAKKLVSKINAMRGYEAFLTRTGDYFLKLRKRTGIARTKKADLFVSVHADGFHSPKPRGASVWVLSESGSKSEIGRWLLQSEKSSELLGGVEAVSLQGKDKDVTKILLDLSMDYSIGASFDIAADIHRKLYKVVPKMHKKFVEQEAFAVLKNPDIPSVLVEAAFISNPKEEKLLKSAKYQSTLAKAIGDGIKQYFTKNPPEGSYLALLADNKPIRYVVRRGDTLSDIATRHNTTISAIKKANKMRSNVVRLGATLLIPRA